MFNNKTKLDKNFIRQNRQFFVRPKFPKFLEKAVCIGKIVLLVLIAKSLVSCGDKECNDYTDPSCKNYDAKRVRVERLEKDSIRDLNNMRGGIRNARGDLVEQYGQVAGDYFDSFMVNGCNAENSASPQLDSVGGIKWVKVGFNGVGVYTGLLDEAEAFGDAFKQTCFELKTARTN